MGPGSLMAESLLLTTTEKITPTPSRQIIIVMLMIVNKNLPKRARL